MSKAKGWLYNFHFDPLGRRFWYRFFGGKLQFGFAGDRWLDRVFVFGVYWGRLR